MTATAPTLASALPFGFRREMAREFGCVEIHHGSPVVRFIVDGRVHRISAIPVGARWLKIRSRETAEEILEEIRREIRASGDVIAAIAPYMAHSRLLAVERRWKEWVEVLRVRRDADQLSRRRFEELEGHLTRGHLDALRLRPLQAVDYAALEALQADLFGRGLAPKTVHHVLADVRTFLRWCARRRWIASVPEVPATLVPEHVPTIPSRDEQRARLAGIPDGSRGYFLARGLLGIRNQEAIRANLADYRRGAWDEESGRWLDELVVHGKGRVFRVLPAPGELATWVREHRPALAEAGEPLFPNPETAGRWSPSAIIRTWRAMEKRLGLAHVKPNEALRHCFGTRTVERLMSQGMSREAAQEAVMRIMGHTSRATSDRYVKLAAETMRGTVE